MVDFLDVATSSRWIIDRMLGDAGDDDFAQLDTSSSSSGAIHESGATYHADASTAAVTSTRPFLSKSAEAELYLLATNFLLCKNETSANFLP